MSMSRPLQLRRSTVSALSALFVFLLSFAACAPPRQLSDAVSPERVVSLVPTVTETLFALGIGDRVVGVSDFDNYPPEAASLPHVGALVNPNVEQIFELQPDLVFTYGTQTLLQERLRAAGIRQHSVISGNIDQALESIRSIGRVMGVEQEGFRLSVRIQEALEKLRASADPKRPSVLLAHSREAGTMGAFYTGGMRSYFNELIEIGGGRNIFEEVDENVFQPSLEEILDRAPEVIIELLPSSGGGVSATNQRLQDWQVLESVPAVRDGRVVILSGDHLLLVGPRLDLAAADIAEAIRGEQIVVPGELR